MIDIGGLDPNTRFPADLLGPGVLLRPGQLLHGIVEAAGGGLALRIGNALVSLAGDAAVTLQAGAHLALEVVGTDHGLQLRLMPSPIAGSLPQAARSDPIAEAVSPLVFSVLKALGNVEAVPRSAHLVPPTLPQTQTALRLVLSLFLTQESLGEDLQVLAGVAGQAVVQGALSAQAGDAVAALVRAWLPPETVWHAAAEPGTSLEGTIQRLLAADATAPRPALAALRQEEIRSLAGFIARLLTEERQAAGGLAAATPETLAAAVRAFWAAHSGGGRPPAPALQTEDPDNLAVLMRHILDNLESSPADIVESAARRATQSMESRLLAALTAGRVETVLAELDRDVRTVLGRLRQHERFAAFLRQTGQEGTFDQAAQRVLDRVSGNQLQNLRGAETPYQFFEIPFPPNAPIRNAQVHILGEEQAPARGFDRENAAVAIDLETTRLGGLWISLTIHQGDCRCWIRAQTPEAVRAIDAHASELAERLKVTGYRGVKVSVSLWRGDRVTEVVNLLAHFRGVNLEA